MHQPLEHNRPPARRVKQDHEKYCSDCGEIILANAEICPNCGVRQMAPTWSGAGGGHAHGNQPSGGRNRIIAAILAILLGGLGGHHFYLGNIGRGVVYLLFSWTFIPGIIAFIEGILYLLMSDVDFDLKYNLKHLT